MDLYEGFEENGFLSASVSSGIANLRAEGADWFKIAEDMNVALMRTAKGATEAATSKSMTPEAVAVRVLLRSCATLQGIILRTERGMVAEGRMLARSLIENAFCIAALHDNPDAFMEILKKDSEASRQTQRKFIVAEKLIDEVPDNLPPEAQFVAHLNPCLFLQPVTDFIDRGQAAVAVRL